MRHSVICIRLRSKRCNKVYRRDSIVCINLQLSDLNGKKCGAWVEIQCNKVDRKRFYCMHQSTAVRICFRLK